jgi:hypothetical protein
MYHDDGTFDNQLERFATSESEALACHERLAAELVLESVQMQGPTRVIEETALDSTGTCLATKA